MPGKTVQSSNSAAVVGKRVVLQFRVDIGVDVVDCEPCRLTEKGTVYCECPGCGEDVALHPP